MSGIKNKILVVGQTPPPYGGQAVMIENMLKGKYKNITFYHVRMAFSKEMDEIGKFKIYKLFHLFEIIFKVIYIRFRYSVNMLYYPPTGPKKIPFYRDVVILLAVRPFFKKKCFHFHAGGISELYPNLNSFFRFLFRQAYYNIDLGIRLSENSPDDCAKLKAKKEYIVPNGVEDNYAKIKDTRMSNTVCNILFVGLLSESKGISVLIDACCALKRKGLNFSVNLMGKFESKEFEMKIKNEIHKYDLDHFIVFLGVCTGENKYKIYFNSDIFCFPSFFEAENFPVVLLEACEFGLPIVSTEWRGIPSIVANGINGYLVPIKDAEAIANRIELLISDPELRKKMGDAGRQNYLEKYTKEKFQENIEKALSLI